jgi:hypothetical protein
VWCVVCDDDDDDDDDDDKAIHMEGVCVYLTARQWTWTHRRHRHCARHPALACSATQHLRVSRRLDVAIAPHHALGHIGVHVHVPQSIEHGVEGTALVQRVDVVREKLRPLRGCRRILHAATQSMTFEGKQNNYTRTSNAPRNPGGCGRWWPTATGTGGERGPWQTVRTG